MADTALTGLTAAGTVNAADLLYGTQSGNSRKITAAQLLTYVHSNPIALAPPSLTGSAATTSLDITQTWNTTGAPTALKVNVTNTASNGASKLLDLQTGGVSQLSVDAYGNVVPAGFIGEASGTAFRLSSTIGMSLASDLALAFSAGNVQVPDVYVRRDAANTLALRNSTNAQAFNVYNTYTDASNYERGFFRYSSNVLQIGHEGAGTGSNTRTIAFRTSGFNPLELDASSATFNVNLVIGSGSISTVRNIASQTGYTQMTEMTAPAAPSANNVRIYAVDNGGKTELLALFPTGAAQRLAIEP